jgi:N6-L-threonylcarbamoyladenine synthase
LEPPFICLVVSGGHSHIVYVENYYRFHILGQTRDDAAGEAFDKVARVLGLSYPGGPMIDKMAKLGDSKAIKFPRVYFSDGSFDFSFSGLKTAVLNYMQKNTDTKVEDICASFQEAAVDVLVNNLLKAAKSKNVNKIALAGGVAANSALRKRLIEEAEKNKYEIFIPKLILCTDNAAMIGSAAYYKFINNSFSNLELNAIPNLKITD